MINKVSVWTTVESLSNDVYITALKKIRTLVICYMFIRTHKRYFHARDVDFSVTWLYHEMCFTDCKSLRGQVVIDDRIIVCNAN